MLLRHSNLIDLYRCSFLAPPPLSRPQPILNGRASAAPLSFFAQEEGKLNALSQCQTEGGTDLVLTIWGTQSVLLL